MSRIIARKRLGNTTEDITFITNGTFANSFAVMDGYEVLIVPSSPRGIWVPPGKSFDLRGLGILVAPRGIAYLESEGLFVVNDIRQRSTLFLADIKGQPMGTRTIQYPDGYMPQHLEGITTRKSRTGEQLIMSALQLNPTLESRLEVLDLVDRSTYQTVQEIRPDKPVGTSFISGVCSITAARLPPTPAFQLLVSFDNIIQRIDSDGHLIGEPVEVEEANSIEGLVQMGTNFFAADARAGQLFGFDQNLKRLPDLDCKYKIGVGLFNSAGLAWNASTDEHLLVSSSVDRPTSLLISKLPPSLDSASLLVDLAAGGFGFPRRMTYVPEEKLIAVAHNMNPQAILLFDNSGVLVETIALTVGRPLAIAYISTTGEFVVRVTDPGKERMLFVLTRNGKLVRTIDLSGTDIRSVAALTFFNPDHRSGGQFLIVDAPFPPTDPIVNMAFITDFNGVLLNKLDYRQELGILLPSDVATITTGENAGALSIVDRTSNEVVVFVPDE
ncbi:MAG TPA: hypothetical protein VEW46_00425 [Pyrinomonadaceae bacterium]|nr:hypothetical protein [Pyrinomonadaceae bacterium]